MFKPATVTNGLRRLALTAVAALPITLWAQSNAPIDDFSYNKATFEAITYTWTDREGVEHVSNLAETATDPEQMKAFVAKIYSDNSIPGAKTVKYLESDGSLAAYDKKVNYPPMPLLGVNYSPEPELHGITAILVELNVPEECAYPYNSNMGINQYLGSKIKGFNVNKTPFTEVFDKTNLYKSMRVLTERSHVSQGKNPGYLFNADQQLKHFFVVLKGKPRENGYATTVSSDIFEHFEQISPTFKNDSPDHSMQQEVSTLDALRKGLKYQVLHDCSAVLMQDHYFCMNRVPDVGDFSAEENLYIYIPEARMHYWTADMDHIKNSGAQIPSAGRDADGAYTWYNPVNAPYLFLYSIKLDLDGHRVNDNQQQISLSWRSTFKAVTGASNTQEEFCIYEIDEMGQTSDTPMKYVEGMFSVPAEDEGITVIYADADGFLRVKSYLDTVRLQFMVDHNAKDDPSRLLSYVVSGRLADKDFYQVLSNTVEYQMYSTQLKVVAEIDRANTSSNFNSYVMRNNYVNAISMVNLPEIEREIEKSDLVAGSRFDLVRTDASDGNKAETILASLIINDIREGSHNGIDAYIYDWTISQNPAYGGTVVTESDSGYFWSERTGNDVVDLGAVVIPSDDSRVYARFFDTFSVSVAGNAHPAAYSYRFDFDPNGALLPDGHPVEAASSNVVTLSVPKSALSSRVLTYSYDEIMSDTDHHLPSNSTAVTVNVANSPTIKDYEIYLDQRIMVAAASHNLEGGYDLQVIDDDTGDKVSIGRVHSGVAQFPGVSNPGSNRKYYGRILVSNGSTYGIDATPLAKGPSVVIDDLDICHPIDAGINDGYNNIGVKNLISTLRATGYEVDFYHYNIWRSISSDFTIDGKNPGELLIRDHNSPKTVSLGYKPFVNNFNKFEHFVSLSGNVYDGSYHHRDGFVLDSKDANPTVTYTVRVYGEVFPDDGSDFPDGEQRFVLAEARSSAVNNGGTTSIEDVIVGGTDNPDSQLIVENIGSGLIRVTGSGQIAVYNLAGNRVALINDSADSRSLQLSAGFYVVTNGVSSVKTRVS